MAKDIVKEILLKFKADTRGVEKDLKSVERSAQSLQKTISGGGGSSLGGMNKVLEKYTEANKKFGMTINKDMTKFQKAVQEVATKDMRVLQTQTDNLFRKTEDRLKRLRQEETRLNNMRAGGADPGAIARQQRRVGRYGRVYEANEAQFMSSAEAFSNASDGLPSTRSRINRFAGYAGTAVAVAQQINSAIQSARETTAGSTATLGGRLQNRQVAAYRGDITEALMEGRDQSLTKASAYADKQASSEGRSYLLGILGKGIAGAGMGALGGAAFAGVGAIPGAIAGGVLGLAKGGSDAYNYYFAGGKEKYREEQRSAEFEREKQRNMTAHYANYIMGKAPGRYDYQRLTGMSDSDALSFRRGGFQNMFGEEQSIGAMMALRGTFGNRGGANLASDAMSIARTQGMDLGTATSLAQTAGMSGAQKDVKKTLTDIYSDAFSKGITDSGLVEVFQKGIAEIVSRSPDVSDMAATSARVSAAMEAAVGGRGVNARDLAGAGAASAALDAISMQGGESGFTKMNNIVDVVGNNSGAMALLAGRTDDQIFQMAKNKDPRLMRMLGPEKVKELEEKFNAASTLSKKFRTTQIGRDALDQAKQDLANGASLSEVVEGLGGYAEVIGGTGPMSKEASAQMMAQVLQNELDPEVLSAARQRDIQKENAALDSLSKTTRTKEQDAEMMNLLQRRINRDAEAGVGTDLSQYGAMGEQAFQAVIAGRNARPGLNADGTQAGTVVSGQMQGASQEDRDAANISTDMLKNASRATQGAVGPGGSVSQSVGALIDALKGFESAVQNQMGTSSDSASGSN